MSPHAEGSGKPGGRVKRPFILPLAPRLQRGVDRSYQPVKGEARPNSQLECKGYQVRWLVLE